MEFKDVAGDELFQMVLEKTVLQMTNCLKMIFQTLGLDKMVFIQKNRSFLKAGLKRLAGSLRKMETLMIEMVRCGSNLQNMGTTRIAWSSERMEGLLTLHPILLTIITRRLEVLTF